MLAGSPAQVLRAERGRFLLVTDPAHSVAIWHGLQDAGRPWGIASVGREALELLEAGGDTAIGDDARLAELADEVAVAGSADACARAVRRRLDAGASSLVRSMAGDDVDGQIERFAGDVLPVVFSVR